MAVSGGHHDCALAIGFDKFSDLRFDVSAKSRNVEGTILPVAFFAMWATRRMHERGTTREHLARIAAKNWNNGALNPMSDRQPDHRITVEEVLAAKTISDPLTAMMSCPVDDGAAAAIVCTREFADRVAPGRPRVVVKASVLRSETYTPGHTFLGAVIGPQQMTTDTARAAYEAAGICPEDIDLVQCHDAFSIEELEYYELLGFCRPGEAESLLESGATELGGRIPLSTDGGLIARGHPGGPTGLAQLWETTLQLHGEAGRRQVEGARTGLCHLVGGGSVAIFTILQREYPAGARQRCGRHRREPRLTVARRACDAVAMMLPVPVASGPCRGLAGRAAVLVPALVLVCLSACSDAPRSAGDFDQTSLVNVFTGTADGAPDFGTGGGAGNTFPGAVLPFGMLQWSPDTAPGLVNAEGGYSWVDAQIRGFSLTHVSGAGCATHQDVPLLPTTEPIVVSPAIAGTYRIQPRYLASFDHAREHGEPGFYAVTLDPGTPRETDVALTTTTRTGIGRFVFPATESASVLFNAGGSAMANGSAALSIDPERNEVSGSVESGQFCYHRNRYAVHFVAEFDRPFSAHGTWEGETLLPAARDAADAFRGDFPCPFQLRPISQAPNSPTFSCGAQAGAYVTFDARDQREVRVRVAVSYVSVDAARDNLRREQGERFDLDGVRAAAREAWRDALGRVVIRGGDDADRRTFYTMLYRALIAPTVFSDADGRYLGMDGTVHDAGGRTRYTTFSGWDIYRSQIPLLAMLFPERASDMMESLVANARESGWLPRWSVAAGHTDVMVGDPAPAMLAGAYAFGARDFDLHGALAAMVKGATQEGRSSNADYVQRQGLAGYLDLGWVPHDGSEGSTGQNTSIFGDTSQVWGSAATTLEYNTSDFAIGAFAAELDDASTCRASVARSTGWRKIFDPATGYVRPRYASGTFHEPFDPGSGEGFVEGNSAQYTWMIPHDVAGLAAAMGGPEAAVARLDAFFAELNAGDDVPLAYLTNEPSALTPWLYDWLGEPAKSQAVVRRALIELFDSTPAGFRGNDDLGQMSAWYVFGALGLYPGIPGTDLLLVGSPLFPEAMLRLGKRTLTIVGDGAGRERPYVARLEVDGAAHDRPWLRWRDLGGTSRLAFSLSDRPTAWGSDASAAPPSYGPGGSDVCAAD